MLVVFTPGLSHPGYEIGGGETLTISQQLEDKEYPCAFFGNLKDYESSVMYFRLKIIKKNGYGMVFGVG